MKWIKTESEEYYSCKTPLGNYYVVGGESGYISYFGVELISAEKDLETAKESVKTEIFTKFYKLKIFLELNE